MHQIWALFWSLPFLTKGKLIYTLAVVPMTYFAVISNPNQSVTPLGSADDRVVVRGGRSWLARRAMSVCDNGRGDGCGLPLLCGYAHNGSGDDPCGATLLLVCFWNLAPCGLRISAEARSPAETEITVLISIPLTIDIPHFRQSQYLLHPQHPSTLKVSPPPVLRINICPPIDFYFSRRVFFWYYHSSSNSTTMSQILFLSEVFYPSQFQNPMYFSIGNSWPAHKRLRSNTAFFFSNITHALFLINEFYEALFLS